MSPPHRRPARALSRGQSAAHARAPDAPCLNTANCSVLSPARGSGSSMEQAWSAAGAAAAGGWTKQVTKAPHWEPLTKGQNTVPEGVGGRVHAIDTDTVLPMATLVVLSVMMKSGEAEGSSGEARARAQARRSAAATKRRMAFECALGGCGEDCASSNGAHASAARHKTGWGKAARGGKNGDAGSSTPPHAAPNLLTWD